MRWRPFSMLAWVCGCSIWARPTPVVTPAGPACQTYGRPVVDTLVVAAAAVVIAVNADKPACDRTQTVCFADNTTTRFVLPAMLGVGFAGVAGFGYHNITSCRSTRDRLDATRTPPERDVMQEASTAAAAAQSGQCTAIRELEPRLDAATRAALVRDPAVASCLGR